MNILVIVLVSIAALALIVFTIIKNRKERKSLVNKLNEDYTKPSEDDPGNDTDSRT